MARREVTIRITDLPQVRQIIDELQARAESAEAEVRALTARLDATHTVIRRMDDGWFRDDTPDGPAWFHVPGLIEPMSPAEAAEIRAATADPTPHTETP